MHHRLTMRARWFQSALPSTAPVIALSILPIPIAVQTKFPFLWWQQRIVPHVSLILIAPYTSLDPFDEIVPEKDDVGTVVADCDTVAADEK